jgi:hypothetical protein
MFLANYLGDCMLLTEGSWPGLRVLEATCPQLRAGSETLMAEGLGASMSLAEGHGVQTVPA